MVMNFGNYDINVHMLNHYKRLNSAKNVVSTRSKRNNTKKSNKTGSVTSVHSRYSTPTFSGGKRAESVQSHYQPKSPTDTKQNRVSSAPSKSEKPRKSIRIDVNETTKNDETNEIKCPNNTSTSLCSFEVDGSCNKMPVPTPRTITNANSINRSSIPEFEYLQFSLRITEDIIRNDLYTNKEMQRVFNSHLEANRDRLNMKKMLEQIDSLCIELNVGKQDTHLLSTSSIQNHEQSLSSKESYSTVGSQNKLINQILSGEKLMSDDDVQKMDENELREVVTKILSSHANVSKETKNVKNENICCINCKDILREPELTVEEILDDFNEDLTNKVIKYNLLSPEIRTQDYNENKPKKVVYDNYLNLNPAKIGVDVSIQTSIEDIDGNSSLEDCCMYMFTEKEKSCDFLMDEIVTESDTIFQNKKEEGSSISIIEEIYSDFEQNIEFSNLAQFKKNEISELKSDVGSYNFKYFEKLHSESLSSDSFKESSLENCTDDSSQIFKKRVITSAPNILSKTMYSKNNQKTSEAMFDEKCLTKIDHLNNFSENIKTISKKNEFDSKGMDIEEKKAYFFTITNDSDQKSEINKKICQNVCMSSFEESLAKIKKSHALFKSNRYPSFFCVDCLKNEVKNKIVSEKQFGKCSSKLNRSLPNTILDRENISQGDEKDFNT